MSLFVTFNCRAGKSCAQVLGTKRITFFHARLCTCSSVHHEDLNQAERLLKIEFANPFFAQAVRRSTIFADSFDALRAEGGDVMIPYRAGVIDDTGFAADLAMLTRGAHPGRRSPDEITLFKSVGLALEDLACAKLLWRKAGDGPVT